MDTKTLKHEITQIDAQLEGKMGNPKRLALMQKRERLVELMNEQKPGKKEKDEKTTE